MAKYATEFKLMHARVNRLKEIVSTFEHFLVGMEALQETVKGLEARIADECKNSEKAWEEAWKWKERAKYFAGILYDNGICPPSVDKMLRGDGDA